MSLLKLSRLLQQNLQEDENFNGQSQKFFLFANLPNNVFNRIVILFLEGIERIKRITRKNLQYIHMPSCK